MTTMTTKKIINRSSTINDNKDVSDYPVEKTQRRKSEKEEKGETGHFH